MKSITNWISSHKPLSVIIAAVIVIPGAAVAWWLGSPLFIDKTVDEEFPALMNAVMPAGMEMAQAQATMEVAMNNPTEVQEEMMEAMGAMLAPEAVKVGQFRDADSFHKGSGDATIYDLGTDGFVLRFEDFNVTNGPDLRVLLTTHPDPMGRGDVHADDVTYVELGKLKGNIGNQNYLIPGEVNVDDQHSVVIYCKPFQVVFAVAPLSIN
ncbi:MAG: DM13 domain-containing protein [Chloroflexi bacterium]|nr:DM13 domain-containing protein [Chloroflexota bacterium]MYK62475.1 DM13 domain-containing protein [Chloroflexota bacterium]